ncbi:MAG: translation initiation factor IF-3 [Chloroflexi bacterium]|nr:translation initiation factor IF-3 [Chloroflexota bacterium]
MIRVPQLRVVDEDGSQLGVMATGEAMRLAQEKGYDLVEVAPMAVPPVARLLDYGQFKYEQARREKEARRHQRSVEFKELRIAPKIGKGDFDTKVRRAIQFLEEGDRVKVTCRFRGRELSHAYIGRDLLIKFGDLIKEHGTVERQPLLEGKSMSIVVASTHKPKIQPASEREHRSENPPVAAKGADAPAGDAVPLEVSAAPAEPIEGPAASTPSPQGGGQAAASNGPAATMEKAGPPASTAPATQPPRQLSPQPVSASRPSGE